MESSGSMAGRRRPGPGTLPEGGGHLGEPPGPRRHRTDTLLPAEGRDVKPEFRGDIDGLRAVAIVLVVLFHSRVTSFSGGFVGVDVFFVISGFLITRNLLAEVDGSGRVSLGGFWAKRVRRLVPALGAMVAVVFALGLVVLSPLEWGPMARDGAASVAYVSNLVFGLRSTNYFGGAESIFQHTWSLSVEEQFYLVWPLLVLAGAWVGPRLRTGFRPLLVTGLVAMSAVSFVLNVGLADRASTWAFYSLPTRMWEFGVAGLLAVLDGARPARRRAVGEAMAGAGLAAIGWAALSLDGRVAYPGRAALLPVLGTALVIRAGAAPGVAVAAALARRPLQWLGRVSYSWYLWHWPLILLSAAALRRDTVPVRLGGSLVALGVAALALRRLEDPVRFSPRLRASLPRTYAVGAAITALALLAAGGVTVAGRVVGDRPFYRELADARSWDVDAAGRPTGCRPLVVPGAGESCVVGDPDAARTVMLVGDSHAGMWRVAAEATARRLKVRVVVRTRGNCPAIPVDATDETGPVRPSPSCRAFRRGTEAVLDAVHPIAVVVGNSDYVGLVLDGRGRIPGTAEQLAIWRRAYDSFLDDLAARHIPVGVLLDPPRAPFDPITCVGRTGSASHCRFDRPSPHGDAARQTAVQRASAAAHGRPTLDVTDRICSRTRCSVRVRGTYVYRDDNHLTDGFVSAQAGAFLDLVERTLRSGA
jgi:peptidoglycan/LPS O-acetylase OafA/YrhL